jgi:CRP-like cAMP-binding protein
MLTMGQTDMSITPHGEGLQNRLLAAVSGEEYERLVPHLGTVPLRFKQVLYKQGERIQQVYFPSGGALSLIKQMQDGQVAEVATIGNEGMVGTSAFFGETESAGEVIVQVPNGHGVVMSVEAFTMEMSLRGRFYNLVIRYYQAFVNQVMQTTVCNALHSAEERGCRWLLMTHDRVGKDEFPLTHEFTAAMLGVRRPTVTLIAGSLQRAGLIDYRRGHVRILNRQGLQDASCECYETVKASFRRLLPEIGESIG